MKAPVSEPFDSAPLAKIKLNPVTLSFPETLERSFLDDYFEKSIRHVRTALLVAIFFYGFFGILDSRLIPEMKYHLWVIRYGIFIPLAFFLFLFSFSRYFKKTMQLGMAVLVAVGGLGIIAMIWMAPFPGNNTYYPGLMLVFFFGYTLFKLRFIWATLAGGLIVLAYESVVIWVIQVPTEALINTNFFFLGSNILGMFAGYYAEYSSRREFLHSRLLGKEKRQETQVNRKLEKMVRDRTAQLFNINADLKQENQERRQAEEAAREASRCKSEFLANMSHELRTPLNHIIGFTELIVDKNFGELNAVQEEYLNDVLQSSHHLLSLINDILDFSKVESGKMTLEPTSIRVRDLMEKSLLLIKEKAMKHKLKLFVDVKDVPLMITADERKFKQIVYNLLSNAVKFTPDGGRISLTGRQIDRSALPLDRLGDWPGKDNGHRLLEISIADTGIGILPEEQERIFNRFEQAEGSSKRRYQGTGLGLTLTKVLVELHGGRIWVESAGTEQGTTFRFVLPL
jgi:signal transduction histidine kinase